jgi:acyl-CoA synthetase (AMP-forming)/AMP-acid ligase II
MGYDEKPWLKHYDSDAPQEIEIPPITLKDRFEDSFRDYPNHPALHYMGRTMTYRELKEASDRFVSALFQAGCRPGDLVGIHLPNIPQYLIAVTAAIRAGMVATGVSPLLTPREVVHQLNDSKTKVLVTLDALFERVLAPVHSQTPHLEMIVCAGIGDYLSPVKEFLGKRLKKIPTGKVSNLPGKRVVTFKDLLSKSPPSPPDLKPNPQDLCLVQYTGGTTGLPKGTMLTHANMVANTFQIEKWTKVKYGAEIACSGFPFFHLAGLAMGLTIICVGGCQILIPNPRDTKHIIKQMAKLRPTLLVNVPSLYMMLINEPGFKKLNLENLHTCISGAAAYPAESIREFEKATRPDLLMEVYGMTETSPILTMNPRDGKKKIGSVGLPVANTRIRLMDLETGTEQVALGEEGELVAHGPQVMKGYLNKPQETAHALREHDGEIWLHTGDVARMDEDGYFYIMDRAKDMLSVGGFKVFSREVEEKLYEIGSIELCALVGTPNPERPGSDIVKLVAQPTLAAKEIDQDILKQEILDFCKENMAPYKVPKIIEFREEIPLTPVGKVDKKALR